jgi:hypothetical protein
VERFAAAQGIDGIEHPIPRIKLILELNEVGNIHIIAANPRVVELAALPVGTKVSVALLMATTFPWKKPSPSGTAPLITDEQLRGQMPPFVAAMVHPSVLHY